MHWPTTERKWKWINQRILKKKKKKVAYFVKSRYCGFCVTSIQEWHVYWKGRKWESGTSYFADFWSIMWVQSPPVHCGVLLLPGKGCKKGEINKIYYAHLLTQTKSCHFAKKFTVLDGAA